ncbi:MAG: PadR family transcriptional regulator, partial [Nocardioides sp.]|uniref:PadR family transcriptional regulator n=1 Tax=Nocardioides sp. TaxID=35761 RepID=UPI003F024C0F
MGQEKLPITSWALLALFTLDDAPLTAYELKQRADSTLRFYWTSPATSQVYTEVGRLTDLGLLEVDTGPDGRSSTYRITELGSRRLAEWASHHQPGFPVFKHPYALRLMLGHLGAPERMRELLTEYLDEVAEARSDLQAVRDFLSTADRAGEQYRYPSLVADWGLAHFDSEEAIARSIVERLAEDIAL